MLSPVGQQQIQKLVGSLGKSAVEQLVANKDVAALQQAGMSKIDALAVLHLAQEKGFDAAFGAQQAHKALGGPVGESVTAQKAVSDLAGQKRAGGLNGGMNMITAARGGLIDGVDPKKVQAFNLQGLSLPHEIVRIADQAFAGRTTRAQFSGYSAPPAGTKYAEHTAAFVGAFADKLGKDTVGMITSPTADQGSIDAITTMAGQGKGIPVLSITAKDYVDYIDPSKFPPEMDKAAYTAAPKYVFGSGAKYNQATALASNAFVATGGRDVTVFDFMRAVEKGNPVVLVVDQTMAAALGDKAIWDADKGRVNNGAAYLAAQLAAFEKTGSLPHPDVAKDGFGAFGAEWLTAHKDQLKGLVKVVTIDALYTKETIGLAAAEAALHVKSFTGPDAGATREAFSPASVAAIKGDFKDNYVGHAVRYAGVSARQLGASIDHLPNSAWLAGLAKKGLESVVTRTADHFSAGKLSGLDNPGLNAAAIRQHAGYVAGELSRKFGIPVKDATAVLVPFYEKTTGGADPAARAALGAELAKSLAAHFSPAKFADELKHPSFGMRNIVTHFANGGRPAPEVVGGRFVGDEMHTRMVATAAQYTATHFAESHGVDASAIRPACEAFYAGVSPAGATDQQIEALATTLAGIATGERVKPDALADFVAADSNGWMFNQYGFGDLDKALNRPGVYAGEAVREFALAVAGDAIGARNLLKGAFGGRPELMAEMIQQPQTREGVVLQFAARAAQAGWLVSKTGQGLVEAHHQDPARAERALARFGPKNDLITDFDSLAAKKGWAEVAKDIDQIKTALGF